MTRTIGTLGVLGLLLGTAAPAGADGILDVYPGSQGGFDVPPMLFPNWVAAPTASFSGPIIFF